MKSHYYRFLILAAVALLTGLSMNAQSAWRQNTPSAKAENPAARADAAEGTIYLGHCNYDDYIYPWDGLSLDYDARVGVAIKLPRDMFKTYIGGKVTALRLGWDDSELTGTFDMFIRTSFDGEDLATGHGTGKFGWNELELDAPFEIPDTDELVVGYYTDLMANHCCIPKFYPLNVPNSCYLYDGHTDAAGKEVWNDYRDFGTMAIMLVIKDDEGKFQNMLEIQDMRYEHIGLKDADKACVFTIGNVGSNSVSSIEVTTTQGELSQSTEVKLSSGITASKVNRVNLPINFLGSGKATVSITKVNGKACAEPFSKEVNIIAVPEEVAEAYTFRPTIEFFGSENAYQIPIYFDEYFMSDYYPLRDRITLVCQHVDDQFMTGNNEALDMMLELCAGDSMKVFLPTMSVDRTDYLSNVAAIGGTPLLYGIPYPGEGKRMYESALERPTFASVVATPTMDEKGKKISIDVQGNVAQGVMPKDEPLFLTVYLMEKEVESDSQKFWDDKEGEKPAQHYTHYNVIREILTPFWGSELELDAEGNFTKSFQALVYSDYNPANLSVIALINRGQQNNNLNREIINSTEAAVPLPAGIENVKNDNELELRNGVFYHNGQPAEMYTLSGVRITSVKGRPGVYLVKSATLNETKATKVVVR